MSGVRSGGGCAGVVIVGALAVLFGLLFLGHPGSSLGGGSQQGTLALPKTVEHKRLVAGAGGGGDGTGAEGLPGGALPGLQGGVYGDAPGTPNIWVVLTAPDDHGQADAWLTAGGPGGDAAPVPCPALRIGGTATCYRDAHTGRTTCTWADGIHFLLVAGPAEREAVQQVLLRVHDGTEQ
ncbi:hypothetical protein C7C46_07460 [Streptomyces tateyamensis]|uniref:DUF4245 domain-containing protein n=1 Tax=Streptomyces tateyamensis TaxID=565073 RepID=A0A2V4NW70_9ACTN|nr:hypothetical protein [Streptomyces tateyamensis]PYC84735.1 hypothetical protein C7C46_07460 [Streptomyces tateyamensis]